MLQIAQENHLHQRSLRLDFTGLEPFEQVKDRYLDLGVRFCQAIALKPSNPAFAILSDTVVLMPLENQMLMSANFENPVSSVSVMVCGSSSVVLRAYDRDGNFLGKVNSIVTFPYISQFEMKTCPMPLELKIPGIARIELHSCSPFTVSSFVFTH